MNTRIAFIASSINPVRQRHLLDWYQDIKKALPKSQLFIGSRKSEIPYALNYKINSKPENLKYTILDLFKFKSPSKNLKKIRPLMEYRPEIIHLLTSNTFATIEPYLQKEPIKLIVSFRGFDINVFPFDSEENKIQTQRIFKRADKLHFVSEALKNTAIYLGAEPHKCIVNRRSINIEMGEIKPKQQTPEKLTILSVGRLVWEKGYFYALEAMAILKEKGYDFEYRIIGDGIDKSMLNFHINRLSLHDHVKLLGQGSQKEVKLQMQDADIYFQPSVIEGVPNTIYEAMYSGLPIISTITGGIPEVLEDGVTAYLGTICSPENYAESLGKLIENADIRKEMGDKARNKILSEFSRTVEIDKWEKIYLELLKN